MSLRARFSQSNGPVMVIVRDTVVVNPTRFSAIKDKLFIPPDPPKQEPIDFNWIPYKYLGMSDKKSLKH